MRQSKETHSTPKNEINENKDVWRIQNKEINKKNQEDQLEKEIVRRRMRKRRQTKETRLNERMH